MTLYVVIQINLSIYFLNTSSKVVHAIPSKSHELRKEMPFPKDKHFSNKTSDIWIDKSLMVSNHENAEDIGQFWENLYHEVFKTSRHHKA
jgi:hypothetical protein